MLWRETVTPFPTPAAEHVTSPFGPHANAKAMSFSPPPIVWLIRPFHRLFLLLIEWFGFRKPTEY
jgi:hypothetical protein